jgi:hypothetical protein
VKYCIESARNSAVTNCNGGTVIQYMTSAWANSSQENVVMLVMHSLEALVTEPAMRQ